VFANALFGILLRSAGAVSVAVAFLFYKAAFFELDMFNCWREFDFYIIAN